MPCLVCLLVFWTQWQAKKGSHSHIRRNYFQKLIPIAPNPKTSHCCICKVAERDLDAYHAINEALIRGSRARASGKPPCTEIAKKFLYLWPNGKIDNLRKSLERHVGHLTEQMAEAREEEKEVARDLNKIADEFIDLCQKNASDAREWALAKEKKDPRDLMFSSNAAAPAMNLISKLIKPKEESDDKPGIEKAIEAMKERRDGRV